MDTPDVRSQLQRVGTIIVAPNRRSSDYLEKFVAREIARWAAPIKTTGVSLD